MDLHEYADAKLRNPERARPRIIETDTMADLTPLPDPVERLREFRVAFARHGPQEARELARLWTENVQAQARLEAAAKRALVLDAVIARLRAARAVATTPANVVQIKRRKRA